MSRIRIAMAMWLAAGVLAAQTCSPSWDASQFPGVVGGLSPAVGSNCVHDDGTGPALYVAGAFSSIQNVMASAIAKYDGTNWTPLGSGLGATNLPAVYALASFDDGTGPALYAAGNFSLAGGQPCSNLARWKNGVWTSVGGGTNGTIYCLFAYSSGNTHVLIVGGDFTTVGAGVPASRAAAWDGTNWLTFGSGMNGSVRALTVFDDGTGPALYFGGAFTTAGGIAASGVAQLGTNGWSAPGGVTASVTCFCTFDFGSGPQLLAGCSTGVYRLSGVWAPLGMGAVVAMCVHAFGGTPTLCVAGVGNSNNPGAVFRYQPSSGFVQLDYLAWLGSGGQLGTLFDRPTPSGPVLTVGGILGGIPGTTTFGLAEWKGARWGPVGPAISAPVLFATAFDDGTGDKLVIGGGFAYASGIEVDGLAIRTSGGFAPLLPFVVPPTYAIAARRAFASFDFGSGPELVVGAAALHPTNGWHSLGFFPSGTINTLIAHDDGSGSKLYAGGSFNLSSGNNIARWSGTAWQSINSYPASYLGAEVRALGSADLGQGPRLYVGGGFGAVGSTPVGHIVEWDGSTWSPLGPNSGSTASGVNGYVYAMLTVDLDGPGGAPPMLIVGGSFSLATTNGVSTPVNNIAAWTGSAWLPLGGGLVGPPPFGSAQITALCVFDDGSGPALYAGGSFTASSTGTPLSSVAKWDGIAWSDVAGGVAGGITNTVGSTLVNTLLAHDFGDGPSLYAGGRFTTAGGMPAGCLVRLVAPRAIGFGAAPAAQSIMAGQPASLAVSPHGTGPFTTQWSRNGVPIPGATLPTLSIPSAAWADCAVYSATVSNACGTAASPPISLFVRTFNAALAIPSGPGSLSFARSGGIPGAAYFRAVSQDPMNGSRPGQGWLGGLFIASDFAMFQLSLAAPPFVGFLDGSGNSYWASPAGWIPPSLSGTPVWAVTFALDASLSPLGVSNISTITLP